MLVDEDIPAIFTGYRDDHDFHRLHRRKTVGNMVFTDRDTCIGDEPGWHRKLRHKKAKQAREYRQRKKDRQAEEMANGSAVQHPKPGKRRRKNPRRLSRSLRSRAGPASALQEGSDRHIPSPRKPAHIAVRPERIRHQLERAGRSDPFDTLSLAEMESLLTYDASGKRFDLNNSDSNDDEY